MNSEMHGMVFQKFGERIPDLHGEDQKDYCIPAETITMAQDRLDVRYILHAFSRAKSNPLISFIF